MIIFCVYSVKESYIPKECSSKQLRKTASIKVKAAENEAVTLRVFLKLELNSQDWKTLPQLTC